MGKKSNALAEVEASEPERLPAFPKFYVHLDATTPIAFNGVEIEAQTAEEAWGKFCEMNSISGSSCDRTINEVKE